MTMTKRVGIAMLVLSIAGTWSVVPSEAADPYPTKPIRLIVPFPPGGISDIMGRIIAQKLTERWGQHVLVDNRPGANGIVGAEVAAKSAPDGYTIIVVANSHAVNPSLYRKLPYDTAKDFAPIAQVATWTNILVVNPSVKAESLKELLALTRAANPPLAYASGGSGSSQHLATELFKMMSGVTMTHVPYKGSAPAEADVIAGHVPLVISPIASAFPHVKAGKLKALAVTSARRSALAPDVPTFAESGLPGYEYGGWLGVLARGGTPEAIVEKLNREIVAALHVPGMKERLASMSVDEPPRTTPGEFATIIRSDMEKWAKVVKEAGIKVD